VATPQKKPQERILIADDESALCELLTELLSDEGYIVDSVASGTDAINRLESGPHYDLLLLDLRMPGINGLRVLELLRRNGNDIPIIMLTG
jgi:CheY-like chemotaxis protein